jgi:X-X-X-Leu-X-X-Gly heptad repeat protein
VGTGETAEGTGEAAEGTGEAAEGTGEIARGTVETQVEISREITVCQVRDS